MDRKELNKNYNTICAQIGDAKFKIAQLEDYITAQLANLHKLNEAYQASEEASKEDSNG